MHFDLVDLRLFLHVAEAGSITAGSDRANLSLASASARIRELEHQSGLVLLERNRRGVRVTAAGDALLRHARRVLEEVERLRGELGELSLGVRGTVRLLANTAAIAEFLPERLAAFLAAHPNIDIELDERGSVDAAQAVADGVADIAIVAGHADVAGLEVFAFCDDRLVLIVPPAHALARRRSVTLATALGNDFIALSGDSALQQHLAAHAGRTSTPMRVRARVRGLDVQCRMVAQGAGVAIVPEAAARRALKASVFEVVALDEPWAERQLSIVVRRLDELSLHARRLVTALAASPPGVEGDAPVR